VSGAPAPARGLAKHSSACLPHPEAQHGGCRGKGRNPGEQTLGTNTKCWEVQARAGNKKQINSFRLDVKFSSINPDDT